MAELWSPEAVRAPGIAAGPMLRGAPKSLLHTTEGSSYAGALSVFTSKGYWPTATASFETGKFQLWQHLPLNLAAQALEHPSGTIETNRNNVAQIELVGSADPAYARKYGLLYVGDFPEEYLAGIARWLRFVADNTGAALVAPWPFGPGAPRVSPQQWDTTTGVCGHCHVPNNSHVDPGAINIVRLLQLAHGDAPMPVGPIPAPPTNIVREYRRRGGGKWKLGTDGGVFADSGAPFFGSMGGKALNAPMTAIVATADENGYWLIGADGGIFAFGNAHPVAPYVPLFHEYAIGARHIVDAVATDNGLELVSNMGEYYDLS